MILENSNVPDRGQKRVPPARDSRGKMWRRRRAKRPMCWPQDAEHTYALWLQLPVSTGSPARAYVTAHPIYRDIGIHSRFAIRLDLPGTYPNKAAATRDGYAVAEQFFRGKCAPDRVEELKDLHGYRIKAHARFRIDCHEWEPALSIRCEHLKNKGAAQTFAGANSPFVRSTFSSAHAAVTYAMTYGERLVLGIIGGLRV